MPHYPEPFYRSARKGWFLQLGKRQILLAPDTEPKRDRKSGKPVVPAAVMDKYHELMASREEPEPQPEPQAGPIFVVVVIDQFLEWVQKHKAERTYEWYHRHCQNFAEAIPKTLTVSQLKPHHLVTLCDSRDDWSPTTKHGLCRAVQRAFQWAEDMGRIDRTPIRKVDKPEPEDRDVLLSLAEYEQIMQTVKEPNFRELLQTAWETGARPREIWIVEAKNVDLEHARWVFTKKSSKGKKHIRVVYLPEIALAITKRLMEQRPQGPLFRNSDGAAWTRFAVNCAFIRLKKKIGRKLHLGAFRKTFGTDALKNGVDAVTAAHLLGHSNTSMLAKVYGRVQQDPDFMAEKARAVKRAKTGANA